MDVLVAPLPNDKFKRQIAARAFLSKKYPSVNKAAIAYGVSRIVKFEDRSAKIIFPLEISREIRPDKKLDSGTISISMPATDAQVIEQLRKQDTARKQKADATKANQERTEAKRSLDKTRGGVIWSQVMSGDMTLNQVSGANLDLVARSKDFRFTKPHAADYVSVPDRRAQLKAKFGHEIIPTGESPTNAIAQTQNPILVAQNPISVPPALPALVFPTTTETAQP